MSFDPNGKTTISNSSLMEVYTALCGARYVLGDMANLQLAVEIMESHMGLEAAKFPPRPDHHGYRPEPPPPGAGEPLPPPKEL